MSNFERGLIIITIFFTPILSILAALLCTWILISPFILFDVSIPFDVELSILIYICMYLYCLIEMIKQNNEVKNEKNS